MRNLKKALSLALALVMIFGMLTVASAATDVADFVDLDKISDGQKEAIALLIDLGIVEGIETTGDKREVAPDAKIDRNSYSKVVFMALQATTDASPYVGAGILKDVAGTWAEGYVNYLSSLKYVAGDLEGYFKGSDNLTVAQACKIMLTAMGYDAIHRGYEQDANWSINIMRDAQRYGLMEGVPQAATAEITRENAFRIIYNALFATSVVSIKNRDMGEWIVTGYENDDTLGLKQYGLVKLEAKLGEAGKINSVTVAAPAGLKGLTVANDGALKSAAESAFNFGPTAVGGKAVFYGKLASYAIVGTPAAGNASLISSTPFVGSINVVKTVYGANTLVQLLDATYGAGTSNIAGAGAGKHTAFVAELADKTPSNGADANGTYSVTVFVNGKEETLNYIAPTGTGTPADPVAGTPADPKTAPDMTVTNLGTNGKIARGDVVDLIANSDGKIETIRITRKTVAKLSDNPVKAADGSTVKLPGVSGYTGATDVEELEGWNDLKKDDVVLYVKIGDVTYFEKADVVEAELTSKNTNTSGALTTLTMGGTNYNRSTLAGTKWGDIATMHNAMDYKVLYALYLDNGGNLIDAKALTEDTSSNYAYVLDITYVPKGADFGSSATAKALLLFTDGTTDAVVVSKYFNNASTPVEFPANEDNWTTTPGDGKDKNDVIVANSAAANIVLGKFVSYSVSSNKYTLRQLPTSDIIAANALTATGTGTYKTGATLFGNTAVNNATVFLYETTNSDGDKVYTAYKGIGEAPGFDTGSSVTAAGIKKSGFASFVFAKGTLTSAVGEYVFFETLAYGTNSAGNRVYSATYVNGEAKSVEVNGTISIVAGGLYTVTGKNSDGAITAVGPNLLASAGAITAVGGEVMAVTTAGTTRTYSYDAYTEIFVVDEDGALVVGSTSLFVVTDGSGTYNAYVLKSTDGYINTLYLVYIP